MNEKVVSKEHRKKTHLSTYMLALFFILLPFEYPLANLGVGSILKYVGMVVMVLTILDILMDGGKIHFDYRSILLVLWLVFIVLSISWVVDRELYNEFSGIYIRNALMFLLVCLVRYDEHELQMLCKAYVFGLVLLLLYMTFVPGAIMYSEWEGRLTLTAEKETGMDQNYLATVISLPFGLVFYDMLNGNRSVWVRIVEAVICGACVYYVVATGSRTGLLELALIAVFCFGANWKKNLVAIVVIVLLLFWLIPLLINVLPSEVVNRYSLEAMLGQTEESGSRLEIWNAAIESIIDGNIFVGYGAGASEEIIGRYYFKEIAVHNYYLAQLLELGLIGFILFTTMGFKMIKEVWRSNRRIGIAFLGILLSTVFLDVLTTKFFWSGMMLMTVAISVARTESQRGEKHVKEIV